MCLWHRWALSMVSTEGRQCGWQQEILHSDLSVCLCRYLDLLLFLWVCFAVGLLKLLQSLGYPLLGRRCECGHGL